MPARDGGAESRIFGLPLEAEGRMSSLEYAQLLPEGKDLQAETVTGTERH
ncbi:MAG TPA: hypothetical protein VHP35_19250 [Terriglobia bacterium]|nr:hypothetical protein [Terriglobia bacterium]